MADYTKYQRGSEWRRWDLHIHTPGTMKNDQFSGKTIEEKWLKYENNINNSTHDVAVVGITDYTSIDNYFKFKESCKSGRITKKFDLVLPNIELRMSPIAKSSPINIHCIFNPEIDQDIETRFLARLSFDHNNSVYSASRFDLIRLGRDLANSPSLDEETAIKAAINQYVIDFSILKNVFKNDNSLREDTIIVVSNNANDGASGIVKHSDYFAPNGGSQLDTTRADIYRFADAIFSSGESNRKYFLGEGVDSAEEIVRKYGSLKPCFHGSDAHEDEKLFNPDNKLFHWIKSNPSFNGLKQTLYEPKDRSRIQALRPEIRTKRNLISHVDFANEDDIFGNQTIYFNEGLNTIVGGKSSGKSLLLYLLAKSVDSNQVEKVCKSINFQGYNVAKHTNFTVTWEDKSVDNINEKGSSFETRRISYLPQLYINSLAEKEQKSDLNQLILNILLEDIDFVSEYTQHLDKIESSNKKIATYMDTYFDLIDKRKDLKQSLITNGSSDQLRKSIIDIADKIKDAQKASTLTDNESSTFTELNKRKEDGLLYKSKLTSTNTAASQIGKEYLTILIKLLGSNDGSIKSDIDRIVEQASPVLSEFLTVVEDLKDNLYDVYTNYTNAIATLSIVTKLDDADKNIKNINDLLEPLISKMKTQAGLNELNTISSREKTRLVDAENTEKKITKNKEEIENLKGIITRELTKRMKIYADFAEYVNINKSKIGSDVFLNVTPYFNINNLPLLDQINKSHISQEHHLNRVLSTDPSNYNNIIELFENLQVTDDNRLVYKNATDFPLRNKFSSKDVLRDLVKDVFELDYSITYRGDDILTMSPGKKGTVLLILLLEISSSDCPILIDQPEDNLDNRTIFDMLCGIINEKKKFRQIIMVTHNANLVVITDAENVIVANQSGQGNITENEVYRFEYISGALENSFSSKIKDISVLKSKGIREHVCEILEGGYKAFKLRERKYAIKK